MQMRTRVGVLLLGLNFLFGAELTFAGSESARSHRVERNKQAKRPSILEFQSHLAGDPTTVGHLKFNFEPPSGTISNHSDRHFLLNSISVGLGERFELGTVPLLDLFGQMRNITLKYNYFRDNEVSLAAGYFLMRFPFGDDDFYTHGLSLLGASAVGDDLFLGGSISTDFHNSSNKKSNRLMSSVFVPEYQKFVDLSYYFSKKYTVTSGVSHTWIRGEKVYQFGVGATAYYLSHDEDAFFSKVGLGFHRYVGEQRTIYLLHLSF